MSFSIKAQDHSSQVKDSLYIEEVENKQTLDKVLHAEPLYIDLIRDLGARKGEKEWNIGLGLTDKLDYDEYELLVEYEFAPINRLGLEIEVPLTFSFRNNSQDNDTAAPSHRVESLKTAVQWSFFVSEKLKTSMALGYLNEIELVDVNDWGSENVLKGNVSNPFFVVAKRWGNNFHTLLYTGGKFTRHFEDRNTTFSYQNNFSLHYMIPRTRNFIGLETNQSFENNDMFVTLRPQMRISLADNLIVGIVAGIPIEKHNERLSSFIRLIYEPSHKH
ncbi:HAEPLYID family protein [Bernardetia sp.]|uniref:HAEPLYID family protein n=1 Tax=Bernardetia sp. TaxID=1937974 RepID=UPI0025BC9224|nr:HAEPLYID family protein [Bernardetia sp.]